MALERLQKILARAGVASRRSAEQLIEQGRVRVDGRTVVELGSKADPRRQRVELDGKRIEAEPLVYVLFHKPREVMCTMKDPEGRQTVADFMRDAGGRVVPVGRLDYHTSGVLLLTNDGDFASGLAHPTKRVEKVYVAKVRGLVDDQALLRWQEPVEIDGRPTRPAQVRRLRVEGDKTWIEVTLHEGKNRQIHRIGEAAGNPVLRLARVSFAGIVHDGLRPGQWRYLSKDELLALKKAYGVPKRVRPAPPLPNADEVRAARSRGGTSKRGAVLPARAVKGRKPSASGGKGSRVGASDKPRVSASKNAPTKRTAKATSRRSVKTRSS